MGKNNLSIRELSDALHIAKSSVSTSINTLRGANWLDWEASAKRQVEAKSLPCFEMGGRYTENRRYTKFPESIRMQVSYRISVTLMYRKSVNIRI